MRMKGKHVCIHWVSCKWRFFFHPLKSPFASKPTVRQYQNWKKNTYTHSKTDQTPSTKHVHCEMCSGTRSKVCAVTRCDSKSTKNPCDRYCLSDCSSVWHAIYIPLMYNAILKMLINFMIFLFISFACPAFVLFSQFDVVILSDYLIQWIYWLDFVYFNGLLCQLL